MEVNYVGKRDVHVRLVILICVCVCVIFCASIRAVWYSMYSHPLSGQHVNFVILVSTCVRVCDIRCKYACGLGQCVLSYNGSFT